MLEKIQAVIAALAPHMPVTLDPRDINPPAAWVGTTRVESIAINGAILTVAADVLFIAQPTGGDADYKTLDTMLTAALPALTKAGASIEYTDLEAAATLPDGGGQLPAYRLSIII